MRIFVYPLCVVMSNWCKSELKIMCLGSRSWSACPPASLSFQSTWKRPFAVRGDFSDYSGLQRWACSSWGWIGSEGKSYKVLYKVSCYLFHYITVNIFILLMLSFCLTSNKAIPLLFSIILSTFPHSFHHFPFTCSGIPCSTRVIEEK